MGEFICNLKKYRQLAGFSQDELAALVMVRRETISRLEAGKYNPSLKLAVDISRSVHKLRIVGNRKLLKPQSGSMCLLKKLRLPLLT